MTSEGLGEMFEGDSADTYARKFPLMLMGGRANGPASAYGERGPPSAWAEISLFYTIIPLHWIKTIFVSEDSYIKPDILRLNDQYFWFGYQITNFRKSQNEEYEH